MRLPQHPTMSGLLERAFKNARRSRIAQREQNNTEGQLLTTDNSTVSTQNELSEPAAPSTSDAQMPKRRKVNVSTLSDR